MSLSTFAELKTSVANYLNRDDLTAVIPDFITLTENRLNRDLRARANMNRAETTTTANIPFYDVPIDLIELRNITRVDGSSSYALSYMSPESVSREYGHNASGFPRAYTNLGKTIKLTPTPDGEYTININYFAKLNALSDTATSNNILEEFPDLYLFGACLEGAIFLNDSEQTNRFGTIFQKALSDVQESEEAARYGGTVMTMNVQGDPGSLVRRGA
tara:strand:- start:2530 stop:3180 length:651 start_codon:yes stop_codon:yes gene_type:complete